MGTGASTLDEINNGLNFLKQNGAIELILMHGVQNFPTAINDLNINRIDLLKEKFKNIPVGYADHTSGNDPFSLVVDLIAIGKGICILEKHITLDRSKEGIDYQAALEPKEFSNYCNTIKKAYKTLGSKKFTSFSKSDLKYREFQKKSIVAKTEIALGEIISRDKVSFIRNQNPGLPPLNIDAILGKKASRNIQKFDNILFSDIQSNE